MALVRVRIGNVDLNMDEDFAEMTGATILKDEPTHYDDGTPRGESRSNGRPTKSRTTVDAAAAEKKKESN